MKRISILLLLVFVATVAVSAQPDEVSYKASNQGWLTSLDEAYAISQKTGKPILTNFTGSDWCGWCRKLTADVFVKDEFKKWADKNVVLLELDFPRRSPQPQNIKEQNSSLQRAFRVQGYPTIWVFEADRDPATKRYSFKALGKTGYKPAVKDFTDAVEEMLKKRA